MKYLDKKFEEFNQILFDEWDKAIWKILCDLEIEELKYKGIVSYWINRCEISKTTSFYDGVKSKALLSNVKEVLFEDAQAMIPALKEQFLNDLEI